ncbi:putative sulfate exporter family transporter [Pigmentibacter sp. JX0631]|uniref:YeiH family protein n=1 Tax=Pigmentibacter sp. JX0631 TaxID=2976982 RepID=UPI002468AD97|nr:putative sulfate exporter family transporter [Pigmentibacter sp. JX0631]WGL58921.1 putative sulfate exporter family transporter [Pigmentibacter sp. JX0631]
MRNGIIFFLFIVAVFLFPYFFPNSAKLNGTFAFVLGIIYSFSLGNKYLSLTQSWGKRLLSWSIVGLGFGMNLITVLEVGRTGLVYSILGILLTILFGYVLGRTLKINPEQSLLVSFGTAICGGSAIAVLSQSIKASGAAISASLAVVFLYNALALLIFPQIGSYLNLNQEQFGLWSALAIHDTSSVIGASYQYGDKALAIATTVKLGRALWIIPFAIIISSFYKKNYFNKNSLRDEQQKKNIPWVIIGFLLAAASATWIPIVNKYGSILNLISSKLLVLTLFLIGTNLTKEVIQKVGLKPFILGGILWVLISAITLQLIILGIISI